MIVTGFKATTQTLPKVGRITVTTIGLSDPRFRIEMIRHKGGQAAIVRLLFDGVSTGSQLVKVGDGIDGLRAVQEQLISEAERIAGEETTTVA